MSSLHDLIAASPLCAPAAAVDALSLRGRRLAVAGDFATGVARVWVGSVAVCGAVGGGAAAGVEAAGQAAPQGALRRLAGAASGGGVGPDAGLVEAVTTSREASVAGWWWQGAGSIHVRVAPPAGAEVSVAGGLARWEVGGIPVAVGLDGAATWGLADGLLTVVTPAPLHLRLAAGSDVGAVGTVDDAPFRGGRAALRRRAREGLRASASDPRVGAALAWARHRLDGHLAEVEGGRCYLDGLGGGVAPRPLVRAAALAGLGATAAGDGAGAWEAVEWLLHQEVDPHDAAHVILCAARLLAWTGDLGFAGGAWPRLRALALVVRGGAGTPSPGRTSQAGCSGPHAGGTGTAGFGPPHAGGTGTAGVDDPLAGGGGTAGVDGRAAVALAELTVLAEALGDGDAASHLRADAAEAAERAGDGPLEVAWLFGPAAGTSAPWTAWAGVTDRFAAKGSANVPGRWLAAAGRPGDAGPGMWRGATHPDDVAAAGGVLLGFVHGLLGAHPDATRQRLTLRPRLPSGWDTLDVAGLPLGDAAIGLRYRRTGTVHRFEVEAEAGAVPPQLVLEPLVPVARVGAVRLDGEDVALNVARRDGRFMVPVQFPLDGARVLEVEEA